MAKGLILYASKYGSTQQYARWLAKDTGFDLLCAEQSWDAAQLRRYDILVFGGGIYAGKIRGLAGFLKAAAQYAPTARLVVFSVGMMPLTPAYREQLKKANLASAPEGTEFFCLPGEIQMDALRWADKIVVKMVAKTLQKKQGGLEARPMQREAMAPLVRYLTNSDGKEKNDGE